MWLQLRFANPMTPIPRLKPHQGAALFSYGFRPFFFFGACDAALAIAGDGPIDLIAPVSELAHEIARRVEAWPDPRLAASR